MKIVALRHSFYETRSRLGVHGVQQSKNKGMELVEKIGMPANILDILLVSSSAPRAIQTIEAIRDGMGLPKDHKIHAIEPLWNDEYHPGNIEQAITLIQMLPPALLVIVITHLEYVFPIAKGMGYTGDDLDRISYLEGFVFDPDIIIPRITVPTVPVKQEMGSSMFDGLDDEVLF